MNKISQLPTGISIRKSCTIKVIQLFFIYKELRFREILKLAPTKANIKHATTIRPCITWDIQLNQFNDINYFAQSANISKFNKLNNIVTKVKLADLLTKQLGTYEKAIKNSNMSPATFKTYKNIISNEISPRFGDKYIDELTLSDIKE